MTDNNERSFTFPVLEHDEETGETAPSADETVSVEFTRDQLRPGNVVTYAETGEEPMLSNPDATVTHVHSVVPDPRKETR